MNKNIQLISKNFHNTNITKNFETSKLFSNFFEIFFIFMFQKLWHYKYNKIFCNIQIFFKLFSKKTIVLVRWREPGIATALGSGEHTVHLLCRSSSIIPIWIVVIYWPTLLSFIHTRYQIKTRQTHIYTLVFYWWIWRESNPRL